jgi:hypothetical protein
MSIIPENQISGVKISEIMSSAFFDVGDIQGDGTSVDMFTVSGGGLAVGLLIFVDNETKRVKIVSQFNAFPKIQSMQQAALIANKINFETKGDITVIVNDKMEFWFYKVIDTKKGMNPFHLIDGLRQTNGILTYFFENEFQNYM